MYAFYEHHRDPQTKEITLTEIRLSSSKPNLFISFKNLAEQTRFGLAIPLMKAPPTAKRVYDDVLKLWTYFPPFGIQVLEKLQEVLKPVGGIILEEVEDLIDCARANRILENRATKKSAEEFFYNGTSAQPQQAAMSKETAALKLCVLFGITAAEMNTLSAQDGKRLYRQAALRLHPDRNNGDGSKMSELNSLWSVWNA